MDEKNESQDVDVNEDIEEIDLEKEPEPKAPKRTPEEQLAYLEGRTQRLRKKLGLVETRKPKEDKPDELGTADLAYLAAKGVEDDEDLAFIHKRMTKWDMSLRDVLKDEDVQAKLKTMKIEREVKLATPSATKRSSSGQMDNLDYWVAKYERTGEYPADFEMRSSVINALVDKSSPNTPPWRR